MAHACQCLQEHIGVNDVFGQDDANLEDEGALLEDEGFQDEPLGAATPATHEVLDRRKALLQLAKRAKVRCWLSAVGLHREVVLVAVLLFK